MIPVASLNQRLSRLSTPTRIILLAVILIPVIVVGVLLFADKRQPVPAAVQVDIVAFNKALAEGDKQLDQAAYDAALASYDQAEAANPVSPAPAVKRGTVYLLRA